MRLKRIQDRLQSHTVHLSLSLSHLIFFYLRFFLCFLFHLPIPQPLTHLFPVIFSFFSHLASMPTISTIFYLSTSKTVASQRVSLRNYDSIAKMCAVSNETNSSKFRSLHCVLQLIKWTRWILKRKVIETRFICHGESQPFHFPRVSWKYAPTANWNSFWCYITVSY